MKISIVNIKNNYIRRTLLILLMIIFIPVYFLYYFSFALLETYESIKDDFNYVWKVK
jgi:hypothetical protein